MRRASWLLIAAIAVAAAGTAWAQTAQVTAKVYPDRNASNVLTGRYYVECTVDNAPTARECVFQINIPTAYTTDVTPSDIRVVDVRPGPDVESISVGSPAQDVPVVFAEATSGTNTKGVWIVAMLKDDSTNAHKHVCDVLFTDTGRATTDPITFTTGSVQVKDASLSVLTTTGTITVANNLFGDLDWNGQVNALDFSLFAQAWRAYNASQTDEALADLYPRANTSTDPSTMLSTGDGKVNALDFAAFALAWRQYNQAHSAAAPAAVKEGSN